MSSAVGADAGDIIGIDLGTTNSAVASEAICYSPMDHYWCSWGDVDLADI